MWCEGVLQTVALVERDDMCDWHELFHHGIIGELAEKMRTSTATKTEDVNMPFKRSDGHNFIPNTNVVINEWKKTKLERTPGAERIRPSLTSKTTKAWGPHVRQSSGYWACILNVRIDTVRSACLSTKVRTLSGLGLTKVKTSVQRASHYMKMTPVLL